MADYYNASDVIGKTLYAKTEVPLYRGMGGNVIYTVQPGEMVGTVTSWIDAVPGQHPFYWEFEDNNKRTYYAEHKVGRFSTSALQSQGTQTVQQQQAAAAAAAQTTGDKIMGLVKWAVIIGAVAYLGGAFIKTRKQ